MKVKINGKTKKIDKPMKISELVEPDGFLAARLNGQLGDLSYEILADADIDLIDFIQDEGKKIFWHSASHIMAMAVKSLFPGVKLAIGPAIDQGFYYDFDAGQ